MDSEHVAPHHISPIAPAVLIVNQDFMARWQTADYLRERGYNIIEATGVSDATGVLESGIHVDIVFLDLHPPDGADVRVMAEWLDKHQPGLALLMTSFEAVNPAPRDARHTISESYELAELAAHIDSIIKNQY